MKTNFKRISYWASVATLGIILGISLQFAKAWTEPASAPPTANIGAPVNTGNNAQYKSGSLGIGQVMQVGTGSAVGYYTDAVLSLLGRDIKTDKNSDLFINWANDSGNVAIGGEGEAKRLDVVGQIHATGDICTDAGGGKCLSATDESAVDYQTECWATTGNGGVACCRMDVNTSQTKCRMQHVNGDVSGSTGWNAEQTVFAAVPSPTHKYRLTCHGTVTEAVCCKTNAASGQVEACKYSMDIRSATAWSTDSRSITGLPLW